VKPETGEHKYLRDKNVGAHGLRTDGYQLLVPMRSAGGVLHSLQFIDPTGTKRFLPGGRVTGDYFSIGRHFPRIDHPHLGPCAHGEPEAIAGLWDADRRGCALWLPSEPKPGVQPYGQ